MYKNKWVETFYSKVVGITFPNRDGSSRLKEIRKCEISEELQLVPEPDNPADRCAVAVCRMNGKQIGYMTKKVSGQVFNNILAGRRYACFISDLTGSYESPGVNIFVVAALPGVGEEVLQAYRNAMVPKSKQARQMEPQPPKRKGTFRKVVTALVLVAMGALYVKWRIPDKKPETPSNPPITTRSTTPLSTSPASTSKPTPAQAEPRPEVRELFEGLTYEEVVQVVGNQGTPMGKVGNQAKYRFTKRDGKTLEAVFEDGQLLSWEKK